MDEIKQALADYEKSVADLKASTEGKMDQKEFETKSADLTKTLNEKIDSIKKESEEKAIEVNKELLSKIDLLEKAITEEGAGKSTEK